MKTSVKSLGSVHVAVLFFGLAGVIGKLTSLPAVTVTLGRVFLSALALFVVIKFRKEDSRLSGKRDYLLIIAAGIIMAVHWTAFLQSVQLTSVAVGTITMSTFPLFAAFLEPYFFHEKLKRSSLIEALIMLCGVFLIVPKFDLDNQITLGVIWGMVGSLTYAVLSLLNRNFSERYSGRVICFYEQLTATLVLLPTLLFIHPVAKIQDIGALLVLGLVCTALAHSLFVSGLKNISVRTAGIISGMESVYGILLAMLLLCEIPGIREISGGMIILGVTLYSTISANSPRLKTKG